MSNFGYDYFRLFVFPAIVVRHVTFGIGYDVTDDFPINAGIIKGLKNKFSESSAGGAVQLESSLSETFIEVGFSWKF